MTDQPVVYTDGTTLSPQEIMMVTPTSNRQSFRECLATYPACTHWLNVLLKRVRPCGINTGFGALVKERISQEDLANLQINLFVHTLRYWRTYER